MKLIEVEPKTRDQAWYRTPDGQYDVLGEDLSTNTAAGRAAGAGAVWRWRPSQPLRNPIGDDYSHVFCTKQQCLDSLKEQYVMNMPVVPITYCGKCGQANRRPLVVKPPFVAKCGKCKTPLTGVGL